MIRQCLSALLTGFILGLAGCQSEGLPVAEDHSRPDQRASGDDTGGSAPAGPGREQVQPDVPRAAIDQTAPVIRQSTVIENETAPASPTADAQRTAETGSAVTGFKTPDNQPAPTKLPADVLKGRSLTPLNPQGTVLLDRAGKSVLLRATVSLTNGLLEMLLCLKETKEHESILTLDGEAFAIHSALLALGCQEGVPVSYLPVYEPPAGAKVSIFVTWTDHEGKLHREPAQTWVRHSRFCYYEETFQELPADLKLDPESNLRYDAANHVLFWYGPMSDEQRAECLKLSTDARYRAAIQKFYEAGQPRQMNADWVFVGSLFHEEPGFPRRYLAEGGYVICVANFPMAMIDLGTSSSSQGRETLTYEAWTERIPPRGSEVLVELIPHPETLPPPRAFAPPEPELRDEPGSFIPSR